MGQRTVLTASGKQPLGPEASVLPLGVLGDEQADLALHGGLEKAVYAYPSEHYPFWQRARRQAGVSPLDDHLPPGSLSENLTLEGLLETEVWAGDVLQFAECQLRVTLPREPCYKLTLSMELPGAARLMADSGFCGFYLAVQQPGRLRAGETFELLPGRRSVSIAQLFAARRAKHLR